MSLRDSALQTQYPIDKIVGVFQGSYKENIDTFSRAFSIAAEPVFRIAHNFKRPVFVELLWSLDQVTWYDGGNSFSASGYSGLAWSDKDYIYIWSNAYLGSANATIYYKVICSWIDGYSATEDAIDLPTLGDKPTQFDSRDNYQKIYKQQPLSFAGNADITQQIAHDLGYSPNFKVFIEAFPNEVWLATGIPNAGFAGTYLFDSSEALARAVSDSDSVDVTMRITTGMGTRRAWVRLYADS